jgi:hypothetical protein
LPNEAIKQVALQARERLRLLDDGPMPEVTACSHSYQAGRVDIPLFGFARAEYPLIPGMNAPAPASDVENRPNQRRPALRVVKGGRAAPDAQ